MHVKLLFSRTTWRGQGAWRQKVGGRGGAQRRGGRLRLAGMQRILSSCSARPATSDRGAADLKGFAHCRRPLPCDYRIHVGCRNFYCCRLVPFFFVVVLRRHWERPSNIVEVLMQHAIMFVSFHVHQLSQDSLLATISGIWYGSLLSAGTDRCSQLVRIVALSWYGFLVRIVALSWYGSLRSAGAAHCSS